MEMDRVIGGMMRAARLDVAFYEEAEHDVTYGQDALVVVVIASVAAAIGGFLDALFGGSILGGIVTLIISAVLGVASFFVYAYLVYLVGTRLFKGTADFGEVQRTLGFAWAPQALRILSFIPILGALVGIVAWIWTIATGYTATRSALDLDSTNAALTVIIAGVIAFIVYAVVMGVFGLIFAGIGFIGAGLLG